MKKFVGLIVSLTLSCLVFAVSANGVFAQGYPNKPIKIIVPFAAGGADFRARLIAEMLTQNLGQQVVVENKPGADGAIGMEAVAKSAPDGYTLLLMMPGASVVTPALYKKVRYDPVKDYEHITQLTTTTVALMVNPSLPIKSLKDLIAFDQSKPGQLNYAASSSIYYLITEMFKLKAGGHMTYIPYKGTGPALTALISGEASMMLEAILIPLPQIKAGKARAIAVCSAKRSPYLPDVPTMAESGLQGFEASTWSGVSAPAGTPKEIVKKLNTEVVKILRMPVVKDRLESGGETIVGGTPEEFTAFVKSEFAKYMKVVKDAGIPRIDQ